MLCKLNFLQKYVIVSYALGSAHENFGVGIEAPHEKFGRLNRA